MTNTATNTATTHRPFANAEEFRPFRDQWVRVKGGDEILKVTTHNDSMFWFCPHGKGVSFAEAFADYEFDDGTPCGVPETAEPPHPPIPDGWRMVDPDKDWPKREGDKFYHKFTSAWDDVTRGMGKGFSEGTLYIRRIDPAAFAEGDLVLVCFPENHAGGRFGRVVAKTADGDRWKVRFEDAAGWFLTSRLRKCRVEPYTLDQLVAEIARRNSRRVRGGGKRLEIAGLGRDGVSTNPGQFMTYAEAVQLITWHDGDPFGVVQTIPAEAAA